MRINKAGKPMKEILGFGTVFHMLKNANQLYLLVYDTQINILHLGEPLQLNVHNGKLSPGVE